MKKTQPELEQHIKELLYDFSKTQIDIANQVGVCKDVVARILKEFPDDFKKARYSGINHHAKKGDKNPMKGKTRLQHHNAKISTLAGGYLTEWAPTWWTGHQPKQNRCYVHQRVCSESNKKIEVPKGMIIHHKDENKLNNNPENLECLSRKQHARIHCVSNLLKEQRLSQQGVENSVLEAQSILDKCIRMVI